MTLAASFLPTGYSVPTSSASGNYMKIKPGDNRIRVLSDMPLTGWEYWNTSDKPVRLKKKPETTPADIRINPESGKPEPVKHFWALLVWNYENKQIEILQVSQASIQNQLAELSTQEDWGHPKQYDLKINKTGEKLTTKYSVIPTPHKALSADIEKALAENKIELEKVFFENGASSGEVKSHKFSMLDNTDGMSAEDLDKLIRNPEMAQYWANKVLGCGEPEAKKLYEEMRALAPVDDEGKPKTIKLDFINEVLNRKAAIAPATEDDSSTEDVPF